MFHSFHRLEPLFSSVRNFGFTALELKFQADETLVPSRRNKSFKRVKLKFHTQETLGEKQDGKEKCVRIVKQGIRMSEGKV